MGRKERQVSTALSNELISFKDILLSKLNSTRTALTSLNNEKNIYNLDTLFAYPSIALRI